MPRPMPPLRDRPTWKALEQHYAELEGEHLRDLFANDPERGERLTLEAVGLYLDYSKHRITDETLRLLLALAEAADLRGRIDAMFRGDKINVTEDRAVLHVAQRIAVEQDRAEIVCLLADGGWKYLSTEAWADDLATAEKKVSESLWW